MFCSKCGSQAMSEAHWCGGCGSALALPSPAAAVPAAAGLQGPRQPLYAAQTAVTFQVQQPQVVILRTGKSAGLAAVLSFFWCGLGQIYNGQVGKGIAFLVGYAVSFLLMFVLIGFLTTPILWIWGMVDAYQTAERLNREAGLA